MFKIRSLDELSKLPNNPRFIEADDFEKLKESLINLPEYFMARPIVLSDRTGIITIIDGNMRYEAAKAIGLTEAPTYLLSGLTKEKEDEIIIRANVSNGEWNYELLANEWEPELLVEWGIEIPIIKELIEEPIEENDKAKITVECLAIDKDDIKQFIYQVLKNKGYTDCEIR